MLYVKLARRQLSSELTGVNHHTMEQLQWSDKYVFQIPFEKNGCYMLEYKEEKAPWWYRIVSVSLAKVIYTFVTAALMQ